MPYERRIYAVREADMPYDGRICRLTGSHVVWYVYLRVQKSWRAGVVELTVWVDIAVSISGTIFGEVFICNISYM